MLVLMSLTVASVSGQVRTRNSRPIADATANPATNDPTYVIGPEDVLKIDVFKEADMSGSVVVRPDGKISVPLLHDVQAVGLTPNALAQSIASKLKDFIEQPDVTVVVTQINKRSVYLMGEISHPGPVQLKPGMTVLQALAYGGGFTEFANRKGIYVLRTEEDGRSIRYPFNYKKAIRGEADPQNLELKPGDTIVVP